MLIAVLHAYYAWLIICFCFVLLSFVWNFEQPYAYMLMNKVFQEDTWIWSSGLITIDGKSKQDEAETRGNNSDDGWMRIIV